MIDPTVTCDHPFHHHATLDEARRCARVQLERETRNHPPVNGCTRVGPHLCILTLPGPVPTVIELNR